MRAKKLTSESEINKLGQHLSYRNHLTQREVMSHLKDMRDAILFDG